MGILSVVFTDAGGSLPPVETKLIGGDTWVAVNCPITLLPREAPGFRNTVGFHGPQSHCNPDGSYTEMEWADGLTWYNLQQHWRAWIPI
ncbi:hypothetical protein DFH06DRAFT_1022295, partial [Mycena polygramma]